MSSSHKLSKVHFNQKSTELSEFQQTVFVRFQSCLSVTAVEAPIKSRRRPQQFSGPDSSEQGSKVGSR